MKKLIYKLSIIFFYGFISFAILVTLGSLFAIIEYNNSSNFSFISFKKEPLMFRFLIIEMAFGYILPFILGAIYFYCFYFYVLKNFFKLFLLEKIFSEKSIEKLKLFQKLNYFPALVFLLRAFYPLLNSKNVDGELIIISFVHLSVIIVVSYYLDLAKKGLQIQQENDLTI